MSTARQRITRAWRALRSDRDDLPQPQAPGASQRASVLTAEPDAPGSTEVSPQPGPDDFVPNGVKIAAAWSWRMLIVGLALAALLWVISHLEFVVVPLIIALLLTALLQPVVARLRKWHVPRSVATTIVVVAGVAAVVGVLTGVVRAFIRGFPDLTKNVQEGIDEIHKWLRDGPLKVSDKQLDSAIDTATKWLSGRSDDLTSGAVSTATTAGEVLVGFVMVLFALFFLLRDGRDIWGFLVSLLPQRAQEPVAGAGEMAWRTLGSYVRATVLVALIDAIGIGVWSAAWGVPLALPIAALVFLSAFIPIVGATLSGAVAVLVALVAQGPIVALIILGGVIFVQQFEGHVLQPLIMGRAVSIHPLAVIIAIATGAVVAGVVGALIAVPLLAVLNTGIRHLAKHNHERASRAIAKAEKQPDLVPPTGPAGPSRIGSSPAPSAAE